MYRRNRYYDPMTGHFTRSDPIGIAGGLDAYGSAASSPDWKGQRRNSVHVSRCEQLREKP
jgi:RHS repeat-associated protein